MMYLSLCEHSRKRIIHNFGIKLFSQLYRSSSKSCFTLLTEDAKKMAVKEEKYDPGYEAAYGGAYAEHPGNSEPCSFSADGLSMSPYRHVLLSKTWFYQDPGEGELIEVES